jgi:copper transport protein
MVGGDAVGIRRRGFARLILAVLVAMTAVVATRMPVSAHTNFVGSDPADSSALSQSPRTISLDFDKRVSPALTSVSLVDAEGRDHPGTSLSVDAARTTRLVVSLPSLARDTYRLSFTTRDSDDLHLTKGSVVFAVGTAPTLTSEGQSFGDVRPLEVVLRWLGIAGISAAVGGLVLLLGVLPGALGRGAAAEAVRRRLVRLAMAGAAAAATAQLLLLGAQAIDVGDLATGLRTLVLESDYGLRWSAEVAMLLGLVALAGLMARRPSILGSRLHRRWLSAGAAALATGVTLVEALSGHSGDSSPSLGNTLFRGAHLLAVDVWVGGLIGLVVVLATLRRLPATEVPARALRGVVAGFSRWAGPAFVVIVVSGLVLAGVEVATVTALLSTAYGLILVAKVLLVAAVTLFAVRHAWLLGRRAIGAGDAGGWLRKFRLSIPGEAGIAVFILVLAAALASSPPARGPQFEPAAPLAPSAVTANANDLVIRVSLRPNLPGRNILSVDVLNTRRPAPGPVRGVSIQLLAPGDANPRLVSAVPSLEAQTYDGGSVQLRSPGELKVSVVVDRGGLPPARADVPWTVNRLQTPPHPPVVSTLPIAPVTDGLAAAIALLAIWLWLRRWRGRRLRFDGGADVEDRSLPAAAPGVLALVIEEEVPRVAVLSGSELR